VTNVNFRITKYKIFLLVDYTTAETNYEKHIARNVVWVSDCTGTF